MTHDWDEDPFGRMRSQSAEIQNIGSKVISAPAVPKVGLGGAANGELPRQAEAKFDVFLTLDKGIHYQQNLTNYEIAILLIRAKSSRVADILPHVPACLAALRSIKRGQVIQVGEK